MAAKGHRKRPEQERRRIVERYLTWRQNMPKRICAEHGIGRDTLRAWVREYASNRDT